MEEEFDKLLTVVSNSFGLEKSMICRKYSRDVHNPRAFMCHIVHHGYVHLSGILMQMLNISKNSFYKYAGEADEAIHKSPEILCLMNEIRSNVGLPRLMRGVKYRDEISNTKTLFGFDYTEQDAIRYINACRSASQYVRSLCKIGRKPLPDGRVYSPSYRNIAPRCNSWYK